MQANGIADEVICPERPDLLTEWAQAVVEGDDVHLRGEEEVRPEGFQAP